LRTWPKEFRGFIYTTLHNVSGTAAHGAIEDAMRKNIELTVT